jgi:Zn-dependent peptidase ImmA (M78 family)/transcriptional regulator with XRE-family HTH domain
MTKSIKALISPNLLVWARKSAGYDVASAAQRLGIDAETLEGWESGEISLTIAKLRDAAELYKRPLAVFYLPEPPKGFSVLKDFRKLPQGVSAEYSPKLRFLIRKVTDRQQWAENFRKEHGAEICKFVGAITIANDIYAVARKVRQLLGVTLQEQFAWHNSELALRHWVESAEAVGLLVFQSSDVSIDEMRGFAIPNKIAPAILINSKDTRSARIFTLFHEFAHILLNAEGVSNLAIDVNSRSEKQQIEIYCNKLAAEILVPKQSLVSFIQQPDNIEIDNCINNASNQYSVSREVIARRLLDLDYITQNDYEIRRKTYAKEAENARNQPKKELKIPRPTIILRNYGRQFAREVFAAYGDDEISARDVSMLLNARLKHFSGIEAAISPSLWKGTQSR